MNPLTRKATHLALALLIAAPLGTTTTAALADTLGVLPGAGEPDPASTPVTIVSLAGDQDNFGYGLGNNVPCAFFSNTGAGDLGIFDRELTSGDSVYTWSHNFAAQLPPGFVLDSVTLEIREIFSDGNPSTSRIVIDGTERVFTINGPSLCGPAKVQTFTFDATTGAFAADGVVAMTFRENGDDIGLDYSRMVIQGHIPTPTVTEAHPAIADLVPDAAVPLALSATLTELPSGAPVPGKAVEFVVGGTIACTGTTDSAGLAKCGGPAELVAAVQAAGFTARFLGDRDFLASSDGGVLLVVDGTTVA